MNSRQNVGKIGKGSVLNDLYNQRINESKQIPRSKSACGIQKQRQQTSITKAIRENDLYLNGNNLTNLPSQANHQHIDTKSIVSGNDLKKDEIKFTDNELMSHTNNEFGNILTHASKYDTPVKKNKTSKLELLNTASTASS